MPPKEAPGLPGISLYTFVICPICNAICEPRLNAFHSDFQDRLDELEEKEPDIFSRYLVSNHHAPGITFKEPGCPGSHMRPLIVVQTPTRMVLNLKSQEFEIINTVGDVFETIEVKEILSQLKPPE